MHIQNTLTAFHNMAFHDVFLAFVNPVSSTPPLCPLQVWTGVPGSWVGHLAQQGVPAGVDRLPRELPGQRPSLCHPQLLPRSWHDHRPILSSGSLLTVWSHHLWCAGLLFCASFVDHSCSLALTVNCRMQPPCHFSWVC